MTRDRYMQGLLHLLKVMRNQNEELRNQNEELLKHYNKIMDERDELKKFAASINGLTDAMSELQNRMSKEESKSTDVADSLIILWGQLVANQVIDERRQVFMPVAKDFDEFEKNTGLPGMLPPRSPPAPIDPFAVDALLLSPGDSLLSADEANFDLWCNEELPDDL